MQGYASAADAAEFDRLRAQLETVIGWLADTATGGWETWRSIFRLKRGRCSGSCCGIIWSCGRSRPDR